MEPTPSQVRNHYSQRNQEVHLERALTFKKAANLDCPSNVCLPNINLRASYYGWLISLISSINQDEDSDQEISDDESEATGESTSLSDIEEDNLDHMQEVLSLGQALREKSLRTTWVPLPKMWSCADTVIARPLLPNSRNPPATMPPPLLKRQDSTLPNKFSESDCVPSTRALVLHNNSRGDQIAPQPKASSVQMVPQQQKAMFEVAKRLMEAIVFTKYPRPILSDDKYSTVEEAWKLAIHTRDCQQALAGGPACTPSVCQLLRGYLPPIINTTFIRLNKAAYLNFPFSSSFPRLNLISSSTSKSSPLFLVRPWSLFREFFEGQQPCSDVPVHVIFDTEYNGVQ